MGRPRQVVENSGQVLTFRHYREIVGIGRYLLLVHPQIEPAKSRKLGPIRFLAASCGNLPPEVESGTLFDFHFTREAEKVPRPASLAEV